MAFGGGIFSDFLTLPWEEARGFVKEELEQLRSTLSSLVTKVIGSDGNVNEGAFLGAGGDVPSYLANTGPKRKPKWDKVDLANGIKNRLSYQSLPQPQIVEQSVIGHSSGSNYSEIILDGDDLEIVDEHLTLTETGVEAGVYGDASNLPTITVDEKGRISQVTLTPIVTSATLADGDYGDITVSGVGTVLTVDNDVVTNAKLADMGANTLKGSIAGGDPSDLDPDDVSTILDGAADPFLRTSAAPGGVSDGDKGDITVSSSGTVWDIDANTVGNTELADMASLTVKVRASNSSGDPSDLALTDGQTAKRVGTSIVSAGFGLASKSLLTSGTGATYTVPAGIYKLKVHVQGPGGGGGGADVSATGSGCGAGGGSGGYAWKIYSTTPGATFTYTIGLKGTGGSAGNNAGNPGTANTVFDSGGSPVTGNLGSGGGSMANGTTLVGASGGAGGTASGGDFNVNGMAGAGGTRWSTAVLLPGKGADSMMGLGGQMAPTGTGVSATGYGAGGSGAIDYANQTDRAGGDGSDGVILVEEFN